MTEQFNTALIVWLLLVLIGCWVAANALIDVGARYLRRWMSSRFPEQSAGSDGTAAPVGPTIPPKF